MMRCTLAVPCFNEAARLDLTRFASWLEQVPDVSLVFVNDGSSDDTAARLDAFAAQRRDRVRAIHFQRNAGKAEAVRQGMIAGLRDGAAAVGYYDADLATPPEDMLAIIAHLDTPGVEVAIGSRVALLGRDIERSAVRHYLGRVFATLASMALGMRVYDTQCGAKAFRATEALEAALAEPFLSRWVFDVELIGRLDALRRARGGGSEGWIVEVPLHRWRDVGASRLDVRSMARAAGDLSRIHRDLRRRAKK